MRYSELVTLIRSNTFDNLITILEGQTIKKISGTTRHAYLFDLFVVKVNRYKPKDESENHNLREYNHYCDYKLGILNVPIVYTRKYTTRDGATILIQERMFRVLELVGDSYSYPEYYTSVANKEERTAKKAELRKVLDHKAFWDGLQGGYNKRNEFRFFDFSRY